MRRVLPVVVVLAFLAAACVRAVPEGGGSGTSDLPLLSDNVKETIGAACGRVVGAIEREDTVTLVSALEDIDGALSSSPDAGDLREYTLAAGDVLPVFEDTAPSEEQLSLAAAPLIELSNALISLGVDECAGIGEVAASFAGPVAVDPDAVAKALAANRAKWEAEGPDTYWMEMSFGAGGEDRDTECAWNRTIIVEVADGRAVTAVTKSPGCTIDMDDRNGLPLTVEALFGLVEESMDARMLEVYYEPVLGYPRTIFVDGDGYFYEAHVLSLTPGAADTSQADAVLAELEVQRETWRSSGISSYTMTVQVDCFCPEEYRGPFDVTVTDGEIETATWKGGPIPDVANRTLLTVEGLFDRIESSFYADSITVTYAPLGYPSMIQIDYSRNTADEELGVRVLRFTVGG